MAKRRSFGRVFRRKAGKRGGGTWYIRVRLPGGVERVMAVGPDRAVAEARLAEIELQWTRERALGVKDVAKVTFAEFWPTAKELLQARHGEMTFTVESGRYRTIEKFFKDRALGDLTVSDVGDFLAHLRNRRGFAPATLNRYQSLLSVVMKCAVDRGFARDNPARGVRRAKEEEHPVPWLSGADIDRILANVAPRYRPVVGLLAETGLRRGEILALQWSDLDFRGDGDGVLCVRRSKTKRPRLVPLTPQARSLVDGLRAVRGGIALRGADHVFGDFRADASELSKVFKTAARAADFPNLRLHDLRHAFASGLLRAGATLPEVGRLIGDSSPSVILRYARHAPESAASDAIRRLAAARAESSSAAPADTKEGVAKGTPRGTGDISETPKAVQA